MVFSRAAGMAMALLLLAALLVPQSAQACSWSYERGYSPEEVKRRTDVIAVRATFRFEDLRGERVVDPDGREWVSDPEVAGVVERGAMHLETIHTPATTFPDSTCMFPARGPGADARGTFWIEQRPEHGRYRILHWEGEYLEAAEEAAQTVEEHGRESS